MCTSAMSSETHCRCRALAARVVSREDGLPLWWPDASGTGKHPAGCADACADTAHCPGPAVLATIPETDCDEDAAIFSSAEGLGGGAHGAAAVSARQADETLRQPSTSQAQCSRGGEQSPRESDLGQEPNERSPRDVVGLVASEAAIDARALQSRCAPSSSIGRAEAQAPSTS
jgi:hypothetical protein